MTVRFIFSEHHNFTACIFENYILKIRTENFTFEKQYNDEKEAIENAKTILQELETELLEFAEKEAIENKSIQSLAGYLLDNYLNNKTAINEMYLKDYLFTLKKVTSIHRKLYNLNLIIETIEQYVILDKNYKHNTKIIIE